MTKPVQATLNFRPMKPRKIGTVEAMVSDLYDQVGGIQTAVVKMGLRGLSTAYAYSDPTSNERISFERVAQLTSADSPAAAQFLAALTGGVLCLPPSVAPASPLELTAQAAKEHGEALAETIKAIGDNVVTGAEYAAVEKEIDEAICALFALKASLKAMVGDER